MPDLSILFTATHVILGGIAVIVGAIALATRKGAKIHVNGGRIFVWTMGLSSLLGAVLGLAKYETFYITFHAGILGATLVTSGMLAARIRTPAARRLFAGAAGVNAANAAGLMAAGLYGLSKPDSVLFGFAAADYFFLFAMAAVAVACDLVMLLRAEITTKHRIAQHLWRMCFGFFIAAGSAFTGPGAKAFPEAIQASGLLSLPELIIISAMLFWLIKTLRRPSTRAVSA